MTLLASTLGSIVAKRLAHYGFSISTSGLLESPARQGRCSMPASRPTTGRGMRRPKVFDPGRYIRGRSQGDEWPRLVLVAAILRCGPNWSRFPAGFCAVKAGAVIDADIGTVIAPRPRFKSS